MENEVKTELSADQYAAKVGLLKSQVLRYLRTDRIPGAYIGCCGSWHIPIDAKIIAVKRGNPNFVKKNRTSKT